MLDSEIKVKHSPYTKFGLLVSTAKIRVLHRRATSVAK